MSRGEPRRPTGAGGELPPEIAGAVRAARSKKAVELTLLDLRKSAAFTDYFLICSGQNVRQVKAIADAVAESLLPSQLSPVHVEGHERAEWVLLDFFSFVVHVFTPETRAFYALERLWGSAERIALPDEHPAGAGDSRS